MSALKLYKRLKKIFITGWLIVAILIIIDPSANLNIALWGSLILILNCDIAIKMAKNGVIK